MTELATASIAAQVVSAAVICGLVGLLLLVIRRSRRRTAAMRRALAAPVARVNTPMTASFDRGLAIGYSVLGVVLAACVPYNLSVGQTAMGLLLVLPAFQLLHANLPRAINPEVHIAVDSRGIETRGAGLFRWAELSAISVAARRTVLGTHEHRLVLERAYLDDPVVVTLDELSPPWFDVARGSEARWGHPVPVER